MPDVLRVEIPWVALDDDRDPTWRENFCVYSYLHPERDWLLYIGKADYQTVRQRLHGDHKADLFDFFARRYGMTKSAFCKVTLSSRKGGGGLLACSASSRACSS